MKITFPKDSREWTRIIKSTILVLLGTFILAFGIEMFIFPFDLVTGGISGIGIILEKSFYKIELLSRITAEIYSSIINWVLFGVGFLVLGKEFAAKTLVSTLFYPLALKIADFIVHDSLLSGTLDLLLDKYAPY